MPDSGVASCRREIRAVSEQNLVQKNLLKNLRRAREWESFGSLKGLAVRIIEFPFLPGRALPVRPQRPNIRRRLQCFFYDSSVTDGDLGHASLVVIRSPAMRAVTSDHTIVYDEGIHIYILFLIADLFRRWTQRIGPIKIFHDNRVMCISAALSFSP